MTFDLSRETDKNFDTWSFDEIFFAGWVREVIYERGEDGALCGKAKEVVYHAPLQAGSKSIRTFKSPAELRPYCEFILNSFSKDSSLNIFIYSSN